MAISAKFIADFDQFNRAVQGAQGHLTAFQGSSAQASGSIQQMEQGTTQLSTKMVALGSFIGTMAAQAVTALAGLAINGVRQIASALGELVMSGGRISAIQQSFETLATTVQTTGAAMLGSMRTGTRGLVADLDLMQAANKAVLLGLPVTAAQMGELAATATTLGRAMGQGATKSFDDLITALGRSSPMILDNLGLSVKVGEANETYAKALGKTAAALTDAEKKTAFYNAAMVAASAKVAELGEAHTTLGDAIARAGVWWANFKTDLGVAIARSPVLNTALSEMGQAFAEAFGSSNSDRVQALTALVDGLALKLVDVASVGISTAKYISQGFSLLRGVLFGVLESVSNIVATMLGANARVAEFAASLPVVGRAWTGVATSARTAADTVASVAHSFEMTKNAAFDAMGVTGAAYDSANTKLAQMRVAMVAASDATAAAKPVQDAFIAATNAQGAAVQTVTKNLATIPGEFYKPAGILEAFPAAVQATEAWNSGLTFTTGIIQDLVPELAKVADQANKTAAAVTSSIVGLTGTIAAGAVQDPRFASREGRLDLYREQRENMPGVFIHPGGMFGGMASGGPTTEGLAYLHNDEYVVPKGGALVRGGGSPVTNHFYLVDNSENLARKVADLIKRSVMQGQKLGSA